MKNFFQSWTLKYFRGDLFGGLTAGIVALPLCLAFGEQTELGAIAGLYGAMAIGVIAAVFGGTPTQISGPTAPMTVVSAVVIAEGIAYSGSLETGIPFILATFFLAGLLESLLGVFKLGKFIRFIPYSVVSGFMSGIGLIIIITQLFPFLGVHAPSGGPLGTFRALHEIPEAFNVWSVMIAVSTIIIIYVFPRVTKKIPSALVALVVLTLVTFLFFKPDIILQLDSGGPVPTGLPVLQLGLFEVFADWDHWLHIFEYALTLAFLGGIDSLLTSVVADNMTKTRHDSDKELIGQGIGNMGAALIGGLPGAGATMRTVINIRAGGRTRISGVIAGVFLIIVLLGLGPVVGHVPNAVLAGILITVGIGIIDYKGMRHLRKIPKADAIVLIIVLLLTVFVDLLVAVAVGMVLATVLFMKNISDVIENKAYSSPLQDFARERTWTDEKNFLEKYGQHVYIKHLDGPLFFGFASRFKQMVEALPDVRYVVIRMDRVPYVDQSGLYALEEAAQGLLDRGIKVAFTGLQGQPKNMLNGINLVPGLIGHQFCFTNFDACATWILGELNRKSGRAPEEDESEERFREI
ncbi:MAG: SulP family inorganic anion transporter [Saprospiraceae bacterium]|nr:SulP family inorganic anion transporter [Saprospiraceae bacterium]